MEMIIRGIATAFVAFFVNTGFALACSPSASPFGGGTGSETNPHLICSADQFLRLASSTSSQHFRLASNIDLSGHTLSAPLGMFQGRLNGAGFAVVGLRMVMDEATVRLPRHGTDVSGSIYQRFGLFTYMAFGSMISNIKFHRPYVQVVNASMNHGTRVGLIAGECNGTLSNVTIEPIVSSSLFFGIRHSPGLTVDVRHGTRPGLAGYQLQVGGLCGRSTGKIQDSSVSASVFVDSSGTPLGNSPARVVAGGVAGVCNYEGSPTPLFSNIQFSGRVRGTTNLNLPPKLHAAGGICGSASQVALHSTRVLSSAVQASLVSLSEGAAGGIVGEARGLSLQNGLAQGTVQVEARDGLSTQPIYSYAGGLVGDLLGGGGSDSSSIQRSSSSATVAGGRAVAAGGIAGRAMGSYYEYAVIENVTFSGNVGLLDVSGPYYGRKAGGIAGLVERNLVLRKASVTGGIRATSSSWLSSPAVRPDSSAGGIIGEYRGAPPSGGVRHFLTLDQVHFAGRLDSEGATGGIVGAVREGGLKATDTLAQAVMSCQLILAFRQKIGGFVGIHQDTNSQNSERGSFSIAFENSPGVSASACAQFRPLMGEQRSGYIEPVLDFVFDQERARLTAAMLPSLPAGRFYPVTTSAMANPATFPDFNFSTTWVAPTASRPIGLRWMVPVLTLSAESLLPSAPLIGL